MTSAGNVWDWYTAVDQVLSSLVLQTAVHCDFQFVVDTFWDVEPVQFLMQQVWQAVVKLVRASDKTRCSIQYTLQLVSNVSWWSGKNGVTIVHARHDEGMDEWEMSGNLLEIQRNVRYTLFQWKQCTAANVVLRWKRALRCRILFSLASLESMELRDNLLKTLPASMSSLTKLRVLDLGSNLLEDLVSLLACTVCTGWPKRDYFLTAHVLKAPKPRCRISVEEMSYFTYLFFV